MRQVKTEQELRNNWKKVFVLGCPGAKTLKLKLEAFNRGMPLYFEQEIPAKCVCCGKTGVRTKKRGYSVCPECAEVFSEHRFKSGYRQREHPTMVVQ